MAFQYEQQILQAMETAPRIDLATIQNVGSIIKHNYNPIQEEPDDYPVKFKFDQDPDEPAAGTIVAPTSIEMDTVVEELRAIAGIEISPLDHLLDTLHELRHEEALLDQGAAVLRHGMHMVYVPEVDKYGCQRSVMAFDWETTKIGVAASAAHPPHLSPSDEAAIHQLGYVDAQDVGNHIRAYNERAHVSLPMPRSYRNI